MEANEEESRLDYSDEGDSLGDEQEQIKMEDKQEEEEVEYEGLSKTEAGSLELIFIMFSHYKKECEELAKNFNCRIRFSISSYSVEQVGECSKEQFGICLEEFSQFMNSINLEEVKLFLNKLDNFKYYNSPYIN